MSGKSFTAVAKCTAMSPENSSFNTLFPRATQAKRQGAAPGNIAAQVNLLSVGQPPVEAAPTPQGYAQQRQAVIQGQNQSHGQGMKEAAVGQDGGQVSVMGSSRPRNAEIDGGAEDVQGGGAGGGMSDQKKQPLNLSQVCILAGILNVPVYTLLLLRNRRFDLKYEVIVSMRSAVAASLLCVILSTGDTVSSSERKTAFRLFVSLTARQILRALGSLSYPR